MTADNRERLRKSDELYDRYGKPLESGHWGEYLAIFPDGRTIIGDTLNDVFDRALETFGPGSYIYKIGPRAVWKLR